MSDGAPNLLSMLAAAERDLTVEHPAPSEFTVDSEERDQLFLTQQMEEDLEIKSQSSISARHRRRRPGQRSSSGGQQGGRSSQGRGEGSSILSSSSTSRSGSALSSMKLQQLQQIYNSTASATSGADSPSAEELWSLLQLTNQHMVALRESEASVSSRHRREMGVVQGKLDQAREQELRAQKERATAEAKASIAEAAQQVDIEILQRKIANNRDNKTLAEEDAMVNENFMREVEDAAAQQVQKIKDEIEVKKRRQAEHDQNMRKENFDVKSAMVREKASLSAQFEKIRKELKMVADERDVLRRNVARRWGQAINADNLELLLGVANQELEKVQQASGKRAKQATPDFTQLYDLLSQSKDSQDDMDREMRRLRDQWYKERAKIDKATGQHGLQSEQGVGAGGSSSSSSSSSGGGGRIGGSGSLPSSVAPRSDPRAMRNKASASQKSSWTGRLVSIVEEEDSDLFSGDGSLAIAESCDGDGESRAPDGTGGGVADLADFDLQQAVSVSTPAALSAAVKMKEKILKDRVEGLLRTKEEVKREKELIQREMAERGAELSAKITDVRSRLAISKDDATQKEEASIDLQRVVAKEDMKISQVVEEARVELDIAKKKKEVKEVHIEQLFSEVTRREFQDAEDKAVWSDLCRELIELNRVTMETEAEAERQKFQMDTSRERQYQVVVDMQQRLLGLRATSAPPTSDLEDDGEAPQPDSGASGEVPPMGEMERARQDFKDATEERNVLLNTMEWKEVQWRNVIEDLESQITSERLALKAKHAIEIQQQKEKLQQELESLRQSLGKMRPGHA